MDREEHPDVDTSYLASAGAFTDNRLEMVGKDNTVYVDGVQNGKTIAITFSGEKGHFVEELAALGMKGATTTFVAGVLDLTAVLNAGGEGAGPMAMLPPNMVQELKNAFAGQGITWTVQTADQGNFLYTDIAVPMVVAKELSKIAAGVMGVSREAPAPAPHRRAACAASRCSGCRSRPSRSTACRSSRCSTGSTGSRPCRRR